MVTHSSILAWRIPWTEEPGGLWSIGSQRARHDWSNLAHTRTCLWNRTFALKACFAKYTYKQISIFWMHWCNWFTQLGSQTGLWNERRSVFREEGQVLPQRWGRKREGEAALLTSGCLTDLCNKVHLYRGVQCSCRKNKVFLNVLAGEISRIYWWVKEKKKQNSSWVYQHLWGKGRK